MTKKKPTILEPLSIAEAAAYLGVSISSIQKFCKSGKLPAKRLGRAYLIYPDQLELLKDRKTKPGPEKSK